MWTTVARHAISLAPAPTAPLSTNAVPVGVGASCLWSKNMRETPKSPYERIMRRTRRENECLVFTGYRDLKGYGRIAMVRRNRPKLAHRVVWEHHHGRTALCVLHHCDNPPCVNIEHLYAGTQADNMRDMYRRGRMPTIDHRGSANGCAKLSWAKAREIRSHAAASESTEALAKVYGVHRDTIRDVINRKTWQERQDKQ